MLKFMSCIDNGYLILSSQQIHMLFVEVQNNAVPKCFPETVYKKKSFCRLTKMFSQKERKISSLYRIPNQNQGF